MAIKGQLPFKNEYSGKENKYLFPDPNVDPLYKSDPKGQYVKEMLEAMYAKYANGVLGDVNVFSEADLIRSYGAGCQPKEIYQEWAMTGQSYPTNFVNNLVNGIDWNTEGVHTQLEKAWGNVNFEIVSPMPQIKEKVKGILDKIDYDIHADTVDPFSNDEKKNKRLKMLVESKYKDWLGQVTSAMSIPQQEKDFEPETKEDLELYDKYGGFKLQCARIAQMLINYTFEISRYDKVIREQMIDDLLDLASAVIQEYIDFETKEIKIKYIDRKNFFIQPSKYLDHHDSTYAGYIDIVDVSYLASMGVDRELLRNAATSYVGILGNPSDIKEFDKATNENGTAYGYDFFKLAVVCGSWIEEDTKYTRWVRNRFGKKRSYDVEFGYVPKKDNEWVDTYKKRMLYEGCWVIGTDVTYSFGISYNQPKTVGRLKLPFHYYKLPYTSFTKRVMPFLDEFQFCWLYYQNGMALGLPDGIAIDMGMMANIELTEGKKASPIQVIDFARSHRVYPYKMSITGNYEGGNSTPFSPVQGIQERLIAYTDTRLNACLKNIYQVTGVELSSPQQNAPSTATQTQMAYDIVMKGLKPVIKALSGIKESASENICWRIQNAVKYDKSFKDTYSGIINERDVEILLEAEKNGVKYGTTLVERPNDQDVINLKEAINLEIQRGTLDSTDKMFIEEQLNAKVDLMLIRMFMQTRINKNKIRMQQERMQAIEAQNQGNLAVNQERNQGALAAKQMDAQISMNEIAAKIEGELTKVKEELSGEFQKLVYEVQNGKFQDRR